MAIVSRSTRPKYREVEQALRERIAAGQWRSGERLPGEYMLASRYGVAYLTVRQAIANLAREGVLVRVRGKGTFVAEAKTQPASTATRHPMVLLLPENWQRIDPYYFPELLEGFQQCVEGSGHATSRYNYDIADQPETLAPESAVACLLLEERHQYLVEQLRDSGHLVLAINHYSGRRRLASVRIDDATGVENAVEHLAILGHSCIGFLAGNPGNLDAVDRQRGFRAAAQRLGLADAPEAGAGFNEASGYEAARRLMTQARRPTALVCASDLSAIGAIKAAHDLRLDVPRDLSVVGFGNFSVSAYITPRLTTVRQSRIELGRAAADALILLASGSDVDDVVLTAELIVRDSAAPPPGKTFSSST